MILSIICDLARDNDCVIELELGPDKAMSIMVYGKTREQVTIGADWLPSDIIDAVKDTIRRANE